MTVARKSETFYIQIKTDSPILSRRGTGEGETIMKTAKWILVLFILMVLASQTQAWAAEGSFHYRYSGNDLVRFMREWEGHEAGASGVDLSQTSAYIGYILGVCDGFGFGRSGIIDVPVDATGRQIVAVVTKYLKDHPERWNTSAASLVIEALKEAFPLKGGK
jgi:hypothetical protein